jgi:methionyl-tRNA formyltransferase
MFPSQIVNSEKMEVKLKKLNPDYIFVFTFPIIDKRIFSIPKKGSVNYHCSLLPKHRGKNPMFWSVLEEDKELGITFHYISEKFDSGDIIEKHIIPASTSYGSEILSNYFHSIAANKFCKLILKMVHDESIVAKSQDGLEYSYDSSDRSKFREINNHMDLEQIKKIVNSFSGYGGAFFKNKNKSYNVIEMVELNSFNIGSNKSIIDEKSIYLRTKDNKICLLISS